MQQQVMKTCKLNQETFQAELNFNFVQLTDLQNKETERQKRILDPSIDIVEKAEIKIDNEKALLLEKAE